MFDYVSRSIKSVGMTAGALALIVLVQPTPTHAADPMITAPISFESTCEYYCRSCGISKHDIVTATTDNASSSHLENCNSGTCSSHSCITENLAARFEQLWSVAQTMTPSKLPELIAANADAVEFNEERSALQFRCEAGTLVASLPLTVAQAAALQSP